MITIGKEVMPSGGILAIVKPILEEEPQAENQHPIPFLPRTIPKILKKVICNRTLEYLNKNSLMFTKQFGYKRKK